MSLMRLDIHQHLSSLSTKKISFPYDESLLIRLLFFSPSVLKVGNLNDNDLIILALSMCSGKPSLHTSSTTNIVWG